MMYKDRDGEGWIHNKAGAVSCVLREDGWRWDEMTEQGWGSLEYLTGEFGAEVVLPEEYMK